jgi:hypothetical protein
MDKRKFNGGNSTKAKGVDKRKNEYKDIVNKVITTEKLSQVLNMLFNKAVDHDDVPAAKILLEYSLGKPKETKDISITEIQPLFPDEL